jgi:hypothetical protein
MKNRQVVEVGFMTCGRCVVSSERRQHGLPYSEDGLTVVTPGLIPRVAWSQMLSYDVLRVHYPQSSVELP